MDKIIEYLNSINLEDYTEDELKALSDTIRSMSLKLDRMTKSNAEYYKQYIIHNQGDKNDK